MIEFIKKMWKKYEELIVYVIVGVIATVVSLGMKFLWNYLFFENTMNPNSAQTTILSVVNWTSGVLVAYPLNRTFVFKSHGPFFKEGVKFFGSRISTWALDWVITMVLGPKFGIDLRVATLVSAVLVTILNYVFSKLLVFRTKKTDSNEAKD